MYGFSVPGDMRIALEQGTLPESSRRYSMCAGLLDHIGDSHFHPTSIAHTNLSECELCELSSAELALPHVSQPYNVSNTPFHSTWDA